MTYYVPNLYQTFFTIVSVPSHFLQCPLPNPASLTPMVNIPDMSIQCALIKTGGLLSTKRCMCEEVSSVIYPFDLQYIGKRELLPVESGSKGLCQYGQAYHVGKGYMEGGRSPLLPKTG